MQHDRLRDEAEISHATGKSGENDSTSHLAEEKKLGLGAALSINLLNCFGKCFFQM